MNEEYQKILEVCQSIIGRKPSVSDSEINDAVGKAKMLYPNADTEKLKSDLLSLYSVKIETF